MKYSELPKSIRDLASWEDNLKARQESLTGAPADACLFLIPTVSWEQKQRGPRLVVAAMCLAEQDCEACYKYLQKWG